MKAQRLAYNYNFNNSWMMKTDVVMISNNNSTFCLLLDYHITQRQIGVIGLLLGIVNVFYGLLGLLLNL